MMQYLRIFVPLFAVILLLASPLASQEKYVTLPEQELPVAYDVDLLIVGGTTNGVAAAIEARKAGASVLLITDRPYLGEDMTATLRLWLEPDVKLDDPLTTAIYNDPNRGQPAPSSLAILKAEKKIPFEYAVAEGLDDSHPETAKRNRLTDGVSASPVDESLQVNGNATVTLDLGESKDIGFVSLLAFHRADDFVVDSVMISTSGDAETWTESGSAVLQHGGKRVRDGVDDFRFTLEKPVKCRYVKLAVKKTATSKRVLLGEIILLPDATLAPDSKTWLEENETRYTHPAPRPMHVKTVLDKALTEAGVKFLYGTYCLATIRDSEDKTVGAVIAGRSGKQIVRAGNVFVTSPIFSRWSSAGGKKLQETPYTAEFVVIGGEPKTIDVAEFPLLKAAAFEIMGEPFYSAWPNPAKTKTGVYPIIRYTFTVDDEIGRKCLQGDLEIRNALENQVRLATFDPDQQFTSDGVFVLASYQHFSTSFKDMARGRELGTNLVASAAANKSRETEGPFKFQPLKAFPEMSENHEKTPGEVREIQGNVKPFRSAAETLKLPATKIPVVGEYDVVVVGGGTTGSPAGIAAARHGAKTLVLEYLHDLGGTGTAGAISIYWYGNRVGFTKEVQDGQNAWNIEQRCHWWRSKLIEAGADVWYGVLGSGTLVEIQGDMTTVKGVLISTKDGPKVVLAKVVIDATGNGCIAQSAGAEIEGVDDREIAVQGHGLPPRNLGASYTNTDYMYVDETDVEDVTHVFVYGKEKFPRAFDFGKILDTRERPRVVGDFSFTVLDQVNKRTYPDTILQAYSNYDTHGYTVEPYMEIEHLHRAGVYCDVPYRSSLARGLDGIMVGGLATSCHRDALPIVRMQPDLQNQGYALGCIAAKAVKDGKTPRTVDIKPVQEHLVAVGNLPERVLTDTDNYGHNISNIPQAIRTLCDEYKGSAVLLWYPEDSIPALKESYGKSSDPSERLACAMVLACMRDPTGADVILETVRNFDAWDSGWNFRGMGQFGWASSPLDRYIMMLGRTGDTRAVPVICALLKKLKAEDDFSHHRACCLALEWIGDKSAAKAIAEHLQKPGMTGYSHHNLETARKWDQADPKGSSAEKSRRDSLIEIGFARTLYRLGDKDGLGEKILRDYATDIRGVFSRHANLVLEKKN